MYSHWPEANEKSEEFRYKTVKDCQDAVGRRGNESGLSRRRRDIYGKSLEETVNEIAESIEQVAFLNKDGEEIIRNLVRIAAKLWLEFGCQRYRIIFIFPPSLRRSAESSSSQSRELVVRPQVRRIGSSQGTELDKEEIIKGCEGEWSTYFPHER